MAGYQNRQPPEGINFVEKGWQRDFWLLVLGFFAALALLTWLLMLLMGWSARWVPFGWEQTLSRALMKDVESDPRRDYLQSLADDLARAGGLDEKLSITLHYQNNDTVNAFATIGGHVFILQGLLDEVKSEQGLAFVLAHEIAHIHHRHPLQAVARQLGFGLVTGLVLGNTDVTTLVNSGGQLAMLDYSRRLEREADAWALAALHRHYGHIDGADTLFRWLAEEKAEAAPPEWLSSHPDTRARIDYLRELADMEGYTQNGDTRPLPDWPKE